MKNSFTSTLDKLFDTISFQKLTKNIIENRSTILADKTKTFVAMHKNKYTGKIFRGYELPIGIKDDYLNVHTDMGSKPICGFIIKYK